jgi:hypothetical protein
MKQLSSDWLDLVRKHVGSVRFGVVQITIHDSKVTQIDRTEKTRVANTASSSNRPDHLEEP